ncbi:MAG TPA: 3-isopropylmalate dehydratase large subunit [Chloroflexota bacterium]
MPQTIAQKILAAHSGREAVEPGELLNVRVDLAMANDVTTPPAIAEFKKLEIDRVWDPDRVVTVMDHFCPAKDIASAENAKTSRTFAREQGITHHYEGGSAGIEHALLPEQGLVAPGEVVIGADSHTCTYGALNAFSCGVGHTDMGVIWGTGEVWLKVPESMKFVLTGKKAKWISGKDVILNIIGRIGVEGASYRSMEFCGDGVADLTMEDRFTICNMATEAQAKNGVFPFDERTREYVAGRVSRGYVPTEADPGASYVETIEVDLSRLEPQVALPFLPSNARPVGEVTGVSVDQAFIGACTNGWLADLRVAAGILKGRKVHSGTRCVVIPATPQIYRQALKEGLIDIFAEAGCFVSGPTCGPCMGGHLGVLAEGERCVSTSNRNFRGRMGHKASELYLASPAVAAASAVMGRIAHPEEVA